VLNGHKAVVIGAPYATHLIVTARTGGGQRDAQGVSVFIVPKGAAGVTTRDYPTVDGFRASEVYLENVKVGADALLGPEGQGLPLVEKVVDEALAATCAEACGVLRKLHEGTLEYTKQRKQFGQPISAFQVLQHRMVDMFIQVEQSISMTYMATSSSRRGRARQGRRRRQGADRQGLQVRRPERHPAARRHGHDRRDGHRPLLQARHHDRERLREHRPPPGPLRVPEPRQGGVETGFQLRASSRFAEREDRDPYAPILADSAAGCGASCYGACRR
jgi:hypothetical protein